MPLPTCPPRAIRVPTGTGAITLTAFRWAGEKGQPSGIAVLLRPEAGNNLVEVHLPRALAESLLRAAERLAKGPCQLPEDLTRQEMRMMELLALGFSNREIASDLHVSVSTVRSHLKNLYRKLGLSSRGRAVALAAEAMRDRVLSGAP